MAENIFKPIIEINAEREKEVLTEEEMIETNFNIIYWGFHNIRRVLEIWENEKAGEIIETIEKIYEVYDSSDKTIDDKKLFLKEIDNLSWKDNKKNSIKEEASRKIGDLKQLFEGMK